MLWFSATMWREIWKKLEFGEDFVRGHLIVAKKGLLIRLIFIGIIQASRTL